MSNENEKVEFNLKTLQDHVNQLETSFNKLREDVNSKLNECSNCIRAAKELCYEPTRMNTDLGNKLVNVSNEEKQWKDIKGNKIPLYRYHANGAHFYTENKDEIGTTTPGSVGKYGYVAEGTACYILNTPIPGTVPWYRYGADAYSHFYTSNWQEIGTNIPGKVSKGMAMEGIVGYVYPTQQYGTCPFYRYVQVHNSQHFYTVDPCEIGTVTLGAIGRLDYKCEGIAAYVFTSFPCPHESVAC